MKNKLSNRLKNKKVIASIISALLLILVNLGVVDNDVISQFEVAINTVLTLLVSFGILSNPDSHLPADTIGE